MRKAEWVSVDGADRVCLPAESVSLIENYLESRYGFLAYDSHESYLTALSAVRPQFQAEKFRALSLQVGEERVPKHEKEDLYGEIYDLTSLLELGGVIHALKRSYIVDTIRMAAGLVQLYELDGSVLDVGCNTGYVLNCLAAQFGCNGVGFDTNVKCIETARDVRFGEECSFLACSDEDLALSRVFDLVICATVGLPTKRILNLASRHISEKGMLLLIDNEWNGEALEAEARALGLRVIHCEVIGGYDVLRPETDHYGLLAASVIAGEKAPARRYPKGDPDWSSFQTFLYTSEFPEHLHTQSHFLSYLSELGSDVTL